MCYDLAHIVPMATAEAGHKAERLVARVTHDDKLLIEQAAALSGQSLSAFVVAHAREAAADALERHGRIRLNAEQSRTFVEALLARPRPIPPALAKAMRNYEETVISDVASRR